MCFPPLFLQTLFADMFIACYNVFYSSQPVLAIGIFDQDVDVDHALKCRLFEWVIHVLVKNALGQNILETVENIVIGDVHIRKKYLEQKGGKKKIPKNGEINIRV